jgi:hypothetical protein
MCAHMIHRDFERGYRIVLAEAYRMLENTRGSVAACRRGRS